MPAPLNAIRTFVTAARHRSMTRAAAALHVTPGAVSRQIKQLEAYLGVALYQPGNRFKQLSETGERYYRSLAGVFDEIETRTQDLKASGRNRGLVIACSAHFMRQWFSQHMSAYFEAFPSQDAAFVVTGPGSSFAGSNADVAIEYGSGPWPGASASMLVPGQITPVLSPSYLKLFGRNARTQLHEMRLLYSQFRPGDWERWLQEAGISLPASTKRVAFPGTYHAYLAAQAGAGIALGRRGMIDSDVRSGRLVAPFKSWVDVDGGFHLLIREGREHTAPIRAFREWVTAEVQVSLRGIERRS